MFHIGSHGSPNFRLRYRNFHLKDSRKIIWWLYYLDCVTFVERLVSSVQYLIHKFVVIVGRDIYYSHFMTLPLPPRSLGPPFFSVTSHSVTLEEVIAL